MLPRLLLRFQDWSEKVGRSESLTLAAINKESSFWDAGRIRMTCVIRNELQEVTGKARAVGGSSLCFKKSFPPFPPLIYAAKYHV